MPYLSSFRWSEAEEESHHFAVNRSTGRNAFCTHIKNAPILKQKRSSFTACFRFDIVWVRSLAVLGMTKP